MSLRRLGRMYRFETSWTISQRHSKRQSRSKSSVEPKSFRSSMFRLSTSTKPLCRTLEFLRPSHDFRKSVKKEFCDTRHSFKNFRAWIASKDLKRRLLMWP